MVKVKADLHNHIRTRSPLKEEFFNKTINKARRRLGPGGVWALINFSDSRYETFAGLRGYNRINLRSGIYVPEKDILVVKGQEVPTKQGHLLVLGLEKDKHLKDGRILEDTIKEAKDHNGILIVDHPFYFESVFFI